MSKFDWKDYEDPWFKFLPSIQEFRLQAKINKMTRQQLIKHIEKQLARAAAVEDAQLAILLSRNTLRAWQSLFSGKPFTYPANMGDTQRKTKEHK